MNSARPVLYFLWLGTLCLLLLTILYVFFSSAKVLPTKLSASAQSTMRYSLDAVDIPPFNSSTSKYVLTAWSGQGMQHMLDSEQIFMLRTTNTLNAQLIKRGPGPSLITDGVRLSYAVDASVIPVTEIPGMSDITKTVPMQGALVHIADTALFQAKNIPVSPYATQKWQTINPYPLVYVTAHAESGKILAMTTLVLPISTELGCRNCHGGDWKEKLHDDSASTNGMGMSTETSLNILRTHDKINSTSLVQAAAKGPVVCASCHMDTTDSTTNTGSSAPMQLNLSAAIHGWHASYLPNQGVESCNSCHPSDPMGITQFWRDRHVTNGLNCTRCHGYLEDHAISLLTHEALYTPRAAVLLAPLSARSVATNEAVAPRQAWVNLPNCASCHDFEKKPVSDTATAFNKWTQNAEELYSTNTDYTGMLYCAGCHGAPHALYPASNALDAQRDVIQPLQYQNNARTLGAAGNCVRCHGETMEMSIHHPLVTLPTQVIAVPEKAVLGQGRVAFPHEFHQDRLADCEQCHHTGFEEDGNMSCTKAGCHDSPTPAAETLGSNSTDIRYFKTAFHGEARGCLPCHEQRLKLGLATGPRECIDCHTVIAESAP